MTLAAAIPLRLTSSWANHSDVVPIPHRYGAVTGALLQYDVGGYQWVWAGHAVARIDSITVDGLPANEWKWSNTTDSAGNPIALVEFGQPQSTSSSLLATGLGKLHPRTGIAMENPADIVWDVLANIAVQGTSEGAFTEFKAECASRGLIAAGSIETADTVQTIVRAICGSVGAIFCADSTRPCRVWPGGLPQSVRDTIRAPLHTVKLTSQTSDICNDLTVQFDYANGTPRQTIQLVAPDSIATLGRYAQTLSATWVGAPRVAYDVAARALTQTARPQWDVQADGIKKTIYVGDDLAINHPMFPVQTTETVLQREWILDSGVSTVNLQIAMGDEPALQLVNQSSVFPIQASDDLTMNAESSRVLTLRAAESNVALSGATVTVDGSNARTSNSAGQVIFPKSLMTPGTHSLDIVSTDGRELSMTVDVGGDGNYSQTLKLPVPSVASAPIPPTDYVDVTNDTYWFGAFLYGNFATAGGTYSYSGTWTTSDTSVDTTPEGLGATSAMLALLAAGGTLRINDTHIVAVSDLLFTDSTSAQACFVMAAAGTVYSSATSPGTTGLAYDSITKIEYKP